MAWSEKTHRISLEEVSLVFLVENEVNELVCGLRKGSSTRVTLAVL